MSNLISRLYNWVTDKGNNVKITASKMDAENDQVIAALNQKVMCSATAPSSPIAGQTWVDTTNKQLKLYRNNEWVVQGIVHIGSAAPTTAQEGDLFYDTAAHTLSAYNGSAWTNTGVSTAGASKNLKVAYASASTVTVTADELILNDGTKLSNVNVTLDIATHLDTGTEENSTWYYIHITAANAGKFSKSATSPTGLTSFACVSAVRNGGAGNFVNFKQYGKKYRYNAFQQLATGSQASYTAIDLTSYVPSPISEYVIGNITHAGDSESGYVSNKSDDSNETGSGAGCSAKVHFEFDVLTANTIYWKGTSAKIYCKGFDITKL